jgi:hypothetical protein
LHIPIGQYLDDPNEFFGWFSHSVASIIILNATANSGLLDKMGDAPVTIEELSAGCGIPPDKLLRIVNFLAAEEIVSLLPDGRVAHTRRSRSLPSIKSAIACGVIRFQAGIPLYQALRRGVTSYEERFGKPVFEHLREHPETAAVFADFMSFLTTLVEDFVFTHHAFRRFERAVDVGGSRGGLLLHLLDRHPGSRGILFDLPEVTAMVADAVGVAAHGDRVEIVGGDFFESVPAGDLYLLKMILHDWNDEECIEILKNIRKSIAPGGRVAVIDHVLPETPRQHPGMDMDVTMLVWATGRERKLSEFRALFDAAGFAFDRVTENPLGPSVVEAVAI